MHGMEQACRLLLADLDRELVDRDSFAIKKGPRSIGIAVATTVMCALLCEYAIKTLQASLRGGSCGKGHNLLELYDKLKEDYEKNSGKNLDKDILGEIQSAEACCPSEWQPTNGDVKAAVELGATNFNDWRYGYPETGELKDGIPKGLFTVAKGLELICRRAQLRCGSL